MARYTVERTSDGRYEFVVTDPPDNMTPLEMAPDSMEPILKSGFWCILLVAVWSAPDIECIDQAIRLAERFPTARFGVRPFDYPEESRRWLPELELHKRSPFWAFLVSGKLVVAKAGRINDDQIAAHVARYVEKGHPPIA